MLGHPVKYLQRVRVGPIRLINLKVGEWRHLSASEVKLLQGLIEPQAKKPTTNTRKGASRTNTRKSESSTSTRKSVSHTKKKSSGIPRGPKAHGSKPSSSGKRPTSTRSRAR
jgi:hypothetical protein